MIIIILLLGIIAIGVLLISEQGRLFLRKLTTAFKLLLVFGLVLLVVLAAVLIFKSQTQYDSTDLLIGAIVLPIAIFLKVLLSKKENYTEQKQHISNTEERLHLTSADMDKFTFITKSLKSGWHTFKKNWKFIILLGIATVIAQIIVKGAEQASIDRSPILSIALWLVSTILAIIISLGWSKVFLQLVRHNHADWNTFKTEPKQWLLYIKTSLWLAAYSFGYMIIAALPFIILGIIGSYADVYWLQMGSVIAGIAAASGVGIYMAIRYQFLSLSVIDAPVSSSGSRNLFKKTGAITEKHWFQLLGFALVTVLLAIIGVLCLVIGLIIVIPVVSIAKAKIYDILKSHHA